MTSYKFKTRPYKHQVRALKKLLRQGSGALFMEMGTGKSKVAIDFACALGQKEMRQMRVLIVCPLSVVGTWESEISKHASHFLPPSWQIINYDKVRNIERTTELLYWDPDIVVADEGHRIKNPTAKQSKAMHRLGAAAPHRVLLTGTPITKSPLDLFSQFKFVNQSIFGTRWKHFKTRYAIFGGFGGHQLKKLIRMKELRRKIQPWAFRVTKDALDLPAILPPKIVRVELSKSRAFYDEFATESIAYAGKKRVVAENVLTRILRCQQIAGGWVKDEDGEWMRVGTEKRDYFRDLLEDYMANDVQKAVVFMRFIPELKDVIWACKQVGYRVLPFYGGIRREYRDILIRNFHETDKPTIFASQIETGSLGIDLTPASDVIYYSLTHGYGQYRQSRDRVHRHGQTKRVRYAFLLGSKTIDYSIMAALRRKQKLEDLILKHPGLFRGEA